MIEPSQIPPELFSVCRHWSGAMAGISGTDGRIDFIRNQLSLMLENKPVFTEILHRIKKGNTFPDLRQATMFENEIILYQDPRRLFSLRVFFFGPGEYTPIHDHNSWGVTGHVAGELEVIKYKRLDNGSKDGFARVIERGREQLVSGETTLTLPLNQGIHQTGNPGKGTIIMVSVYGSPLRRLHINIYDMERQRIYRMFSPKLRKKMLAVEALKTLENKI